MEVTTVDVSQTCGTTSAAQILGVSSTHVIRLAEAGQLRSIRSPIGRLFMRDEVERLAADRAGEPTP